MPKRQPRPITPRRLKIAERTLEKERDKYPLLVDWIAAQQPTPEERLLRFQKADELRLQATRDLEAQTWRRARKLLRLLPRELQDDLLEYWSKYPFPGNAHYFADIVFQAARPLIDTGVLALPEPDLDPRYRLQQMLKAAREARGM